MLNRLLRINVRDYRPLMVALLLIVVSIFMGFQTDTALADGPFDLERLRLQREMIGRSAQKISPLQDGSIQHDYQQGTSILSTQRQIEKSFARGSVSTNFRSEHVIPTNLYEKKFLDDYGFKFFDPTGGYVSRKETVAVYSTLPPAPVYVTPPMKDLTAESLGIPRLNLDSTDYSRAVHPIDLSKFNIDRTPKVVVDQNFNFATPKFNTPDTSTWKPITPQSLGTFQ